MTKENYVKAKTLKDINADIIIILGERSNGKSFAVKECVIKDAYKNDIQFGYLRRYDEDTKDYLITEYFSDVIRNKNGHEYIKEWTNGEYTTIMAYRKSIYFANFDPKSEKLVRGKKIGRMFGLSSVEHYKSLAFPNIKNLVYEEFITDGYYLPSESKKLFSLMSTIFRHEKGKVFCIGNKISRVCPYFGEFGLVGIPKQKANTIEYYNVEDSDNDSTTRIAVYMTHSMKINSGMFFGNNAKSITSGEWETDEQPHLHGHRDDYTLIYTLVFAYDRTMFLCEFLQHKYNPNFFTWYVTPKTTEIQKGTRVISNHYDINNLSTIGFIPLSKNERIIFDYLIDGKVCFLDNLTGTEFKQCFDML